ncbi:hypothetical protein K443DRAFT_684240 [Laccaria amethystina LaAM-08-1]|uniref:Uncharacterized protein n=1 Tax=Laccaria amethystina LaAM-08-1 TaxID=1095629 RepID=A0A0C9WXU6_9AGAR|nr:hypothetical protein K443DRAFT_684240 [Laccaria amethystina LaAM-08-1]
MLPTNHSLRLLSSCSVLWIHATANIQPGICVKWRRGIMATVDSERLWELVESKNLDSFFRIPGQLAVVTAHPMLQDTSGSTIKAETALLPSSVRVGTNNVLIVAILRMGFTEIGRPAWNEFIQAVRCERCTLNK